MTVWPLHVRGKGSQKAAVTAQLPETLMGSCGSQKASWLKHPSTVEVLYSYSVELFIPSQLQL